jgi:F-type H+-transporting ATPase subunit gamma
MAGGQERALRRRIRSVQSTKKITKAMELIAASQIVRSLGRMNANRPYREGMARLVVEAVKGDPAAAEGLLGVPEERSRVAVLTIVGDRGLSGPYNSSTLRTTERLIEALRREGVEVRLFTVGKKAPAYFRFRNLEVERSFVGMSERPQWADARTVAATVVAPFVAHEVDQVLLVSTRYLSAGSQAVQVHQLLPLPEPGKGALDAEGRSPERGERGEPGGASGSGSGAAAAAVATATGTASATATGATPGTATPAGTSTGTATGPVTGAPVGEAGGYTEFEPDVETLLAQLAPRAVETEIFAAMLEGAASFFTAQQRAMAAASDNADELVKTLTRVMNRARQDAITTEIMEIVGGAEALRQSKGA